MDHFTVTRFIRNLPYARAASDSPNVEWPVMRGAISTALWPFPDAGEALRRAMEAIGQPAFESPA